ncbi:MAG: nucleotidyl transferase AbiEii/AbiGii toxin family protein [Pikeienuella sp.]
MNTPSPSRWGELFDIAHEIFEQCNREAPILDQWSLGGGTALMLQVGHRESHDIDLFVNDPQVMNYLNPSLQDYLLSIQPSDYITDGTSSLKIVFDDIGEIDIICCGALLPAPTWAAMVRGCLTDLETPAEIVAKKVFYRGARLQPRDIFDIAAVAHVHGDEYIAQALGSCQDKARDALIVTEQMNVQLVQNVLGDLNVMDEFAFLKSEAQSRTIMALRAAESCCSH